MCASSSLSSNLEVFPTTSIAPTSDSRIRLQTVWAIGSEDNDVLPGGSSGGWWAAASRIASSAQVPTRITADSPCPWRGALRDVRCSCPAKWSRTVRSAPFVLPSFREGMAHDVCRGSLEVDGSPTLRTTAGRGLRRDLSQAARSMQNGGRGRDWTIKPAGGSSAGRAAGSALLKNPARTVHEDATVPLACLASQLAMPPGPRRVRASGAGTGGGTLFPQTAASGNVSERHRYSLMTYPR